jgi:UDP-N-acetylglucosamine diphosphorylase/glucosamine-1-phosphate N-acetyltransferase
MNQNLIVTILAGGEGKRMNSNIPKVLHMFNEKPMLVKIIETVMLINPKEIIIITGKYNDLIQETIAKYINNTESLIKYIIQDKQLGTGHAIKCCLPYYNEYYNENEKILILNGDMPLITKDILDKFIFNSNNFLLNILVSKMDNPTGYGRIIYNDNKFIKIVEEKDCNEYEKKINIINSGIYIVDSNILQKYIPLIENNNSQKEYYLTDIVKIVNTNIEINTFLLDEKDNLFISGVNTINELNNLLSHNK